MWRIKLSTRDRMQISSHLTLVCLRVWTGLSLVRMTVWAWFHRNSLRSLATITYARARKSKAQLHIWWTSKIQRSVARKLHQERRRRMLGLNLEECLRTKVVSPRKADLACKISIKTCLCSTRSEVLRTKTSSSSSHHQALLTSMVSKWQMEMDIIWNPLEVRFSITSPSTRSQFITSFHRMDQSSVVIKTSSSTQVKTQLKDL